MVLTRTGIAASTDNPWGATDHAKRITNELNDLMREYPHSSRHSSLWANILVDHTHRAALEMAVQDLGIRYQTSNEAVTSFQKGSSRCSRQAAVFQ